MKNSLIVLCLLFVVKLSIAQSPEKAMEQRAREMYRVLGLNDRAAWKKFIQENYTQALIDRPMKVKVVEDGPASETKPQSAKPSPNDNMEAKVNMLERLHNDFGGSKLESLKQEGETLVMRLSTADGDGKIMLKFEKQAPYKIDGLGVELGMNR